MLDWVEVLVGARACVETVDYDLVLLDLTLPMAGASISCVACARRTAASRSSS